MLTLDHAQEDGAAWLARNARAYLADVPGFGKTPQAISAAERIKARRICVVCPASAVPVWRAHFPLVWPAFRGELKVVSYDSAVRGAAGMLNDAARGFDVLVVDEAHRVKNPTAKRTALVLGTRRERGLAHGATRVWLLSGTPTPNGAHEWWTPLARLWPERLTGDGITNEKDWLDQLFNWYVGTYGPVVKGCRDPRRLARLLDGIVLRREWSATDLPPLVVRELPIEVQENSEGMEALLAIEQECTDAFLAVGEDALPVWNDDTPLAKLRRQLGEVKAPLAAQLILDAARDGAHRQIVFCHHHSVLDRIQRDVSGRAEGVRVLRVDGKTPQSERVIKVDEFQSSASRPMVFLAQLDACKEAITLTAADRVLIVEPSWVPDDNVQAIKRAHRRGQTRPVLAQFLTLQGTLDAVIQRVLLRKAQSNIDADRALRGEFPDAHPVPERPTNGTAADDFAEPVPE